MKRKYKLSTCLIIMSALSMLTPFTVAAQKADPARDAGDELSKPANTWPKGDYVAIRPGSGKRPTLHLGPTGLWGAMFGQNVWVLKVDAGSPAHRKMLPGDVIYGAYGKTFPVGQSIGTSFAAAITRAETKEAGGKLVLNIRRDNKFIKVSIQLKVMGSFSSTTPYNCEKSKNIVARAEEYMLKGLRPKTGLPNNQRYMYAPFSDSVLFLMASGNPKCQGLVRRHIRLTMDKIQDFMDGKWRKNWGHPTAHKGWGTAYYANLFAEYYHQTGDATVLPYLDYLLGKPKEKDWSWPPKETPNSYALHPNANMVFCQAKILAQEAGIKVNEKKLLYDIKYNYHKRAEYGWVKYMGYGAVPFSARQKEAPLEITPEMKETGTYKAMNGKLGSAAVLYSMVDGYDTAVKNCSIRCVYAFNYRGGHGGHWFNSFWTPAGAYFAGPEKFQHYMKGEQWWRELNRDYRGAIWQMGNAKGKADTLGTGFAIHRVMHLKKLRMFGAPRSYFCADPPDGMKPALAAHRNRNYALAEKLTLKVLASGKIPDHAKDRVNHFLNSVRTLKESVEYDLTFTERCIKEGNYALACVELPQLKMVVSATNPRLKAITKALSSTQAQEHIAAVKNKAIKQPAKRTKDNPKARFNEEVRSMVALVKDGHKHFSPIKYIYYPTYPKSKRNQWRLFTRPNASDRPPKGWEQPTFDDSKWRITQVPIRIKRFGTPMVFLRTPFDVRDVKGFKSLRVRMVTGWTEQLSNLKIYLNGELVAWGSNPPKSLAFNLAPKSLKLLKRGKNILAVSCKYGHKSDISLRLEGVLKKPAEEKSAGPDLFDDLPDL